MLRFVHVTVHGIDSGICCKTFLISLAKPYLCLKAFETLQFVPLTME